MDLTVSPLSGAASEAHVNKIYQASPETINALKLAVK
jgi:hypothetical protein